ncbi:GNAT family N-acetyltransferase [Streptomyces orinoci]|uniref:GNAT family N-acetyltransferase n=1 Tax=Streptomyces orinoci TaxID=67339 RepID=A0ABV3JWM5_STRON|nr:GNAT family N-acetyltransferase [Streptomyces orinoci]
MPGVTTAAILRRLEAYYDAVPRSAARAEDFGPLTLFIAEGRAGHPYYARPALDRPGPVEAADVERVRARQRQLGLPESFEWVAETAPTLRSAVEGSGLAVQQHPLMVLDEPAPPARTEAGVRILDPEDPLLPQALAAAHLAFGTPGTGIGPVGPAQLDAQARELAEAGWVRRTAGRMRAGLTVVAAAVTDGTVLGSGQHQPVGPVSEIVGVGTLPSARRRGLAAAVTAELVHDARTRRGVTTVFLTAADDDIARGYARLGFRRVGTALIAGPPE